MLLNPTKPATQDLARTTSVRVLTTLSAGFPGSFHVRFWDGALWQHGTAAAEFTLALKNPASLRSMFLHLLSPAVGFGEAYIFDEFDIEGDILHFTEWVRFLLDNTDRQSLLQRLLIARLLLKLPKPSKAADLSLAGKPTKGDHRIERDREAISYTYDLPGAVYELFLDRYLQYTCGYFADASDDLDRAQERKMDHICRKLRLAPGQRLADFGCGWGGLLIYAARKYGAQGVGFTLSRVQAEYARRAIDEAGVADRVRIELCDFREFHPDGSFDKATSVGVGEHIGHENLPLFFAKVHECLRPGGLYLHHTINLAPGQKRPRWTAFSHKYVFPNGEMQTILYVLQTGAGCGFEIRDVENLREHYVLTLQHWIRKLEANRERIVELAGEVRYRIFRLYMAGATMGFDRGVYNLTQSLFAKLDNGRAEVPMTRADLYV